MPVTTAEAQSRMEAKLDELARRGVQRVLLYGAGRHTLKVGEVLGGAKAGDTRTASGTIADDYIKAEFRGQQADFEIKNWAISRIA